MLRAFTANPIFLVVEALPKAATTGNAEAQCRLAYAYATGRGGVVRDMTNAIKWFKKAAEQGEVEAHLSVASVPYRLMTAATYLGELPNKGMQEPASVLVFYMRITRKNYTTTILPVSGS